MTFEELVNAIRAELSEDERREFFFQYDAFPPAPPGAAFRKVNRLARELIEGLTEAQVLAMIGEENGFRGKKDSPTKVLFDKALKHVTPIDYRP